MTRDVPRGATHNFTYDVPQDAPWDVAERPPVNNSSTARSSRDGRPTTLRERGRFPTRRDEALDVDYPRSVPPSAEHVADARKTIKVDGEPAWFVMGDKLHPAAFVWTRISAEDLTCVIGSATFE